VSRRDRERLEDILISIDAIKQHLTRGELSDGLVFDAVRVRLIEIGEAVRLISSEVLATEPELPWTQIAGMRNRLAHQYFDTSHAVVAATVQEDLPTLRAAVERLIQATVDE
jgi:uncharacterized protein with HEPN domain